MRPLKATNNERFDRFWAAYPRKVGKPKAQAAFAKLHVLEHGLEKMLTAIEQQTRAYGWD